MDVRIKFLNRSYRSEKATTHRPSEDVKGGNAKAVGALIGQARKENANANPQTVREIALRLINEG